MWWFVGFLVLCFLFFRISTGHKYSSKFIKSVTAKAPEKIKLMLKKEFPQHDEIFTTSLCSVFLTEYFKFACSKTGEKNSANALTKYEALVTKETEKGLYRLDDELLDLAISKMPKAFQETLQHEDARYKFDRAIDLGARQAAAEC